MRMRSGMERAVYDTILLDNAVALARDWAKANGDNTLILWCPLITIIRWG